MNDSRGKSWLAGAVPHRAARACARAFALASVLLIASCQKYDASLLPPESNGSDTPGVPGSDAGPGEAGSSGSSGDGGPGSAGNSGNAGSSGAGAAGTGEPGIDGAECTENPGDPACPRVCPESCNGEDDDCDGEVDEGEGGGCGLDHAVSACVAGECRIVECTDGYRDCDDAADTGCEAAPDDVLHCGQCNHACSLTHAIPACVDGECVAAGCENLFGDCDDDPSDCETPTNTLDNCAVCGVTCSDIPNAIASCAMGYCGPGWCASDYGDCNETPGDGCEQLLNTLEHCGGCGQACALTGATADCGSGTCLETGCEPGYGACDDDPTNGCNSLSTSTDCGACHAACDTSLSHVAAASCVSEVCGLDCAELYGDCDELASTGCETPINTNERCGGCDTPCEIAHAEVSCDTGSCTFERCKDGHGNCNGSLLDGCETSLDEDRTCGSCDNDCTVTTDPVCSGRRCTDVICPDPNTADCNQNGLPCEVDLRSNVNHCGGCDAACRFTTTMHHASAGLVCASSACQPVCDTGWGNCNGDYRDGCETPLNTLTDCGTCGRPCAIANASETCASGTCQVDTCASDFADCNGDDVSCETPLGTISDCTGCDVACNLNHAVPTCAGTPGAHSCAISACTQTFYEDCDGMPGNGCEIDERSNVRHCGACDNDCAAHPNVQSATCGSSACNYTCRSGFGNCNATAGCETPLDTLANCGGCNVACSRANATASCGSGSCQLADCNDGYGNCDGDADNGCEPLDTLANCGACGDPCLIPNGTGSCATRSCAVSACNTGWADCDGSPANGCERNVNPPAMGGLGPCLPDTSCTQFSYDGRAYSFCTNARSWTDARARCQLQLLGDLVHVNDAAEDAFVRSHLVANAWTGARDTVEGAWRWANDDVQFWTGASSGTAVAYAHWNAGEPNDYMGNEDCAEIRQADGLWNDQNCASAYHFVCEVQADLCPSDPNKANPGQCGCGTPDTDSDADGTANCNDGCPNDGMKTAAGQCGCGMPDTDSDADGTANCDDGCPNDAAKLAAGVCGCGVADTDTDNDGTPNCRDSCPNDPMRTTAPCGFNYTPSNFDPTGVNFAASPTSTLNCGTTTVDTSGTGAPTITNWCGTVPTALVRTQSGGPDVVVLPLQGLTVASGNTLRVIGARPVVLAVAGNVSVAGTISARGVGATPGAGGNVSCSSGNGVAGTSDSGDNDGAGGGGGGAFAASGANGGAGDAGGGGGAAGTAEGSGNLSPLRGGCRGGAGGNGNGTGGAGGAGGGAVQISATGTIAIASGGIVSASGGGGLRGSSDEDGGGGGGSGGAVLLEAGTVSISSGAWVTANGGAGASGNSTENADGAPGTDGYPNNTARAPGGPGRDGGGGGGGGGAQQGGATGGGNGLATCRLIVLCTSGGGGGGGGGGTGRVRVRGVSSCSLNGQFSPGATTSCP